MTQAGVDEIQRMTPTVAIGIDHPLLDSVPSFHLALLEPEFGADRVDCQLHLGTFSRTEIVRQTFVSRGGDHDFLLPCHGGPFW